MGYNSELTKKQKSVRNQSGNKPHKLYRIGKVLRIVGASILIISLAAGAYSGSVLFFVLVFFNPIAWAGALLLAFGQYFVSNWKYK